MLSGLRLWSAPIRGRLLVLGRPAATSAATLLLWEMAGEERRAGWGRSPARVEGGPGTSCTASPRCPTPSTATPSR